MANSPLQYGGGNPGNPGNVRPPNMQQVDYTQMGVRQLVELANRGDKQAQAVLEQARAAANTPPIDARQRAEADQAKTLTPTDYRPPSRRDWAAKSAEGHVGASEPMPTPEDNLQPQGFGGQALHALGQVGGRIGGMIPREIPTYTPDAMRPAISPEAYDNVQSPAGAGPPPQSAGERAFQETLKPGFLRAPPQQRPPGNAPSGQQGADFDAPTVTPPAASLLPNEEEKSIMDKLFGPDKSETWQDIMRFGLSMMKAGTAKPGSTVGPSFLGAIGEAGSETLDRVSKRKSGRAKAKATAEEKKADRAVKREQIEATRSMRDATLELRDAQTTGQKNATLQTALTNALRGKADAEKKFDEANDMASAPGEEKITDKNKKLEYRQQYMAKQRDAVLAPWNQHIQNLQTQIGLPGGEGGPTGAPAPAPAPQDTRAQAMESLGGGFGRITNPKTGQRYNYRRAQ